MPGMMARRQNPVLKTFGDRLRAAGLAPKAVIGTVMRKPAQLIYGVINSGLPFDQKKAAPRLDFQDADPIHPLPPQPPAFSPAP